MCEYGFVEGKDFNSLKIEQVQVEGKRRVKRIVTDHQLTIDMAKELCMIQRTEVEKQWNSPDAIIAKVLRIANKKLVKLNVRSVQLIKKNKAQEEQLSEMQRQISNPAE